MLSQKGREGDCKDNRPTCEKLRILQLQGTGCEGAPVGSFSLRAIYDEKVSTLLVLSEPTINLWNAQQSC